MTRRAPSRHAGFFRLLDAMRRGGCPICLRIVEETRRGMENLLYENVNDPAIRAQIRCDGGLCARHSRQLARFGDALGCAIIFRDVLSAASAALGPPRSSWRRRRRSAPRPCLFCRHEAATEELVAGLIVRHAADVEVTQAWEGVARLCVPHLRYLIERMTDAASRDALIALHRRKYEALCAEMARLIQSQSYDRRGQPPGPEKDSWLRALAALAGEVGAG